MSVSAKLPSDPADRASAAPARPRPSERAAQHAGPAIVELVGPAGAGKTSVLQAIQRHNGTIRLWRRFGRARRLHLFTRYAPGLAPTAYELLWNSPRSASAMLRHLLRLKMLERVVSALPAGELIVMDEGPVYSLCQLGLLRAPDRPSVRLERAWRGSLDQWRRSLDAVIWLDGPNAVLADRIRARPKSIGGIERQGDEELYRFLDRFRCTYRAILDELEADGSVPIVAIDTGSQSLDQTDATVLAAVARLQSQRDAGADR
jgi:hypothetical protein